MRIADGENGKEASLTVRRWKCGLLTSVVCVLMLSSSRPALGQSLAVQVQPSFERYAREGAWTNVGLRIDYTGPPMSAQLSTTLESSFPRQIRTFARSVALGAKTGKVVSLLVPPPSHGRLDLVLSDRRRTLTKERLKLRMLSEADLLVASLDPTPGAFTYLGGYSAPYGKRGKVHVARVDSSQLPAHWQAYEAVDVLVVTDETSAPSFSAAQQQAIRQWVESGGCFVAVASKGGYKLGKTFWAELLPGKIVGSRVLEKANALGGRYGKDALPPKALLAAVCKLSRGYAACEQGGVPLVAFAKHGLGTVAFVAFDISGRAGKAWPGTERLWRDVFAWIPPRVDLTKSNTRQPSNYRDNIYWALGDMPGAKSVEFGFIVWVLLAYIVILGPINYVVLKRMDKREWCLFTIPVTALVFGLGTYAIGFAQKGGEAFLNEISFLEATAGSRVAKGTGYFALFAPRRAAVSIRSGRDPLLIEETAMQWRFGRRKKKRRPDYIVRQDGRWGLRTRMYMWTMRTFRAPFVSELPGTIEASLWIEKSQLKGEIRNKTPWDLEDCAILFNGQFAAKLGKLAAMKTVQLPKGRGVSGESSTWRVSPTSGDALLSKLKYRQGSARRRAFTHFVNEGRVPGRGPVLIGWAKQAFLTPEVSAFSPNRKIQEAVVAVQLQLTPPRQLADLPSHGFRVRLVEFKAANSLADHLNGRKLRDGYCVFRFEPMGRLDIQEIDSLEIRFSGSGTSSKKRTPPKFALAVYDWTTHKWDALGPAKPRQKVPNPTQHVRRPEGHVLVKVSVQGSGRIGMLRLAMGGIRSRAKK